MTGSDIRVRPIRTEEDHDDAVARIAELMGSAPGTPEGDELDILATLVDAWESKHQPIDAPDPITAVEFRMEQQGLTRKDLEQFIGSRARVSEILGRRRKLTIEMIRRLRAGLGISADLLINSNGAPHSRKRDGKPSRKRASTSGQPRPSSASLRRSG